MTPPVSLSALDSAHPDQRRSAGFGSRVRRAAPALLLYAAVRALGVAVLAGWALARGTSARTLLSARWDSLWYTRVVEHGYGFTLTAPDGRVLSDLAFFPLLPWLEQAVSAVTPLAPADAGLLVSAVASLAAAAGLFAIGDLLYGRRAGVLLAVLWAALPVGVVQSMAYSESLFTALAAWSLYAVLTGRWVWAGALAALSGLTRPVGLAVAAALWATAARRLYGEQRGRPLAAAARDVLSTRLLLGLLAAPLGWAGFVAWVGARTGKPLGYLDVQKTWGNGFDFGLAFARFVLERLTGSAWPAGLGLLAGLALLAWACVLCVRARLPLPLLVYTGGVVVLAVAASGYFGSKPRLLMPAFPLLLPPALALARIRPARTALVIGVIAAGSAVYGAFWLHGSGPP